MTGLGWSRNLADGDFFELPAEAMGAAETTSSTMAARISARSHDGVRCANPFLVALLLLAGHDFPPSLMSMLPRTPKGTTYSRERASVLF